MAFDFSVTGNTKLDTSGFTQGVSSMTVAAGTLIADLVKSAAGQVSELVSSAIDGGAALQQSIGGVETLFKDSAETVKANAAEAYKTTGLSANAYMEQTTSFAASLLSSLGNDTDEAARVAHMAMVDMSDNANKMGTDMSAIQNAYQGFAKQNYTMLDNLKLGYGGTKTEMERLLADAEAFSGVHYDINNLSDVYNAIHVVQNELGITGTTAKEAATTISGSAAAMQASWENVLANLTLGEDLKPALESLVDTTKTYLCENLLPAVGNIISGIPQIITSLIPEILDAGSEFLDVGLELVSNLGSGLVQGIPDLLSNALPIIVDLASGLRENAGKIVDAGLDLIVNLATGLMNGLPTLIEYLPGIVSDIAGIINDNAPKILEAGIQLILMLSKGLLQAVPTIVANIPQICKAIFDVFTAFRWLDIGSQIVEGLWKGLTGGWTTLVKKVGGLAQQLPDIVKRVLGIHSPSKVFTEIGENVTQGLVNGINTGAPAAEQAIQNIAQTLSTYGPDFATVGATITEQFRTKLTEGWAQIQSDIQTDALGAIETLATALKDGDLESLGLWAASYFWQACTKEQQSQIQAVAMGALNQLGSALSGVFGNLSQLAMGLVAQFVPAAASATAGQTALNVAMDANPILFVISLIGMLVGALLSFSGKNKEVASGFQSVWAGVEDFMSYIFEGLMRIVAAGIEGFVILINGLIGLYNSVAWVWGDHVDYISNPAWDYANKIAADRKARQAERKKQQEAANNPSSSGASTNSQKVIESMTDTSKTTRADGSTVTTKVLTEKLQAETGKITQRVTKTVTEAGTKLVDGVERSYKTVTTYVDGVQTKVERSLDDITKTSSSTGSTTPTAPTPDKDLTDAVEANTEALLAANSKLAEMVRQANSLVLSDNMAISRSVAASGTAQVAAAASNYHREGDTNITQNIYSKAQTAADLQREARWEADRAKAQKR